MEVDPEGEGDEVVECDLEDTDLPSASELEDASSGDDEKEEGSGPAGEGSSDEECSESVDEEGSDSDRASVEDMDHDELAELLADAGDDVQ